MRIKWSIRKNLVILVLAATLPLACLLVYALQENYRQALKEAERSAMRTCEMVAADSQRFVLDVQELLSGLAARPLVRALDPDHCDPLLVDFRNLFPRYANLAIADGTGEVICSALESRDGKRASIAGSKWFADAKRANRFSAGTVHVGPVSRKKVAVLAQPIQDPEGEFAGLIGYSLDLQAFDPMPKDVLLPSGMLISIVDAAGAVISRSDGGKDAIGQPFPDRDALALAGQGRAGVGLVGRGDEARLVSYARISGTDWLVIGVQPSERVLSKLSLLANQKYLFAFLLILLGAGSAFGVGRLITMPIDHIAGVAGCIAEGKFETRARCDGPKEIAAVAARFNEMLDVQQRTGTELRAKNAALEQSEQQISAIMNNAPAVIFMKDVAGRYIHVNRQFEALFDISDTELRGKTDYDIFPAEIADNLTRNDRLVVQNGRPVKEEEQVPGAEGLRTYLTVKFPLRRSTDDIYAICGIATDVSDRKRAEEEKLLLEQQFQQSQKLESLGVLAGGIAHDFNNILSVIAGHCSLAELQPETAGMHLPPIEKAVERAAELCRQMLTYAGKAQFVQSQVDMAALVDDMVQMLRATISKSVDIQLDLAPDIPRINGDASQLRQIVMNLIINASEAIGEAHGVIRVKLAVTAIRPGHQDGDHLGRVMTPGRYVCLEVSDTGCGMDEETKSRLFEPFYTTKFTGRGLGMSAVLGILTAHDGALQLSSYPCQGTTFKVYLPAPGSRHAGDQQQEPAAPAVPWQGSGTVLLVEDEEQVLFVAKNMLAALGFAVMEAKNGREALESYRNNGSGIDLVITDIGMPLMGGYELIGELKKINPALPMVVSSGFGDTVVSSRLAREDVAGLVSKPYNLDQLREVLKSVLDA